MKEAVPVSHRGLLAHGLGAAAINVLHQAGIAAETAIEVLSQTGNPAAIALEAIITAVHALSAKGK